MKVIKTLLPGVLIIEPTVYDDERGFFMECFNQRDFEEATGLARHFVQDNHSRSHRGVLRGIHYQLEQPQGKLVRVVQGHVFDVSVDLRRKSPTFAQWIGVELSAENHRQLWMPEGFGHAFLVLSESADFVYKATNFYHPASEQTLLYSDPALGIAWPKVAALSLSTKDQAGVPLCDAYVFEESEFRYA